MGSVNKVILIGNLGADPEMRQTQNATPVVTMRLATNEVWTSRDGERNERTEWHRVVVWGKQAQTCNEYLRKGRPVYVEGSLRTREWQDKEGQKRYTTEVVAQKIVLIGSRPGEGGGRASEGAGDEAFAGEPAVQDEDLPF